MSLLRCLTFLHRYQTVILTVLLFWIYFSLLALVYIPWEDIFKFIASAAEFCEWVQVEIDVYNPNLKYQVKPHSSPWFSAACAAIVHRNRFFRLYQKDKSSESKVKFRQASDSWKRVLKEVWYNCSVHHSVYLFIIEISSHNCSVTMSNIVKKYLWRKIHELNILIRCSDDS